MSLTNWHKFVLTAKNMLSTFHQPASLSYGSPVEGVETVQGITSAENMNTLLPTFILPEKGGKADDEEKKTLKDLSQAEEDEVSEEKFSEVFHLVMNISFHEMIKYLLMPNHPEILTIRNKLLQERDLGNVTIFSPSGIKPQKFELIRDNLYIFQFQIFETSKGLHFHMVI